MIPLQVTGVCLLQSAGSQGRGGVGGVGRGGVGGVGQGGVGGVGRGVVRGIIVPIKFSPEI